jgi:transcriptional regulator with XRE-family HTH domain
MMTQPQVNFDCDGFQREVGLLLRRRRKRRDLTQEKLAEQIGLKRATYANIELGRQRVSLDVAWRAAIVLQTNIDALTPESLRGRTKTQSPRVGKSFLKTCPFCGALPEFKDNGEPEWWLGCMNCTIGPYLTMDTREDCIAFWNDRPDDERD